MLAEAKLELATLYEDQVIKQKSYAEEKHLLEIKCIREEHDLKMEILQV